MTQMTPNTLRYKSRLPSRPVTDALASLIAHRVFTRSCSRT
jgi:hypothetical protein